MKLWKGLFMKEWLLMKGWFYASITITVITALVLPVIAVFYLGHSSENLVFGFMASSPLWLIFSLSFPAVVLMASLGRESVRPDIWLHSTASVFKLFGVKIFFAFIIGMLNYIISLILVTILFSLRTQPFQLTIENSGIQYIGIFLSGIFLASMMLVCISLFFRVFYLVIRPYTKGFSIMITWISFFIFAFLIDAIIASSLYQKISEFGKLGSISEKRFQHKGDFSFFIVNESTIYIGEIFLSITFAVILFVAAAVLFERKVRL